MTGTLFNAPRYTPVNSTGRPRAGAKLYFYRAGTSTPATVYTTSSLGTPHTSPVTATASGEFPAIYLDPNTEYNYKAVLQTSDSVQVWSEDNIPNGASPFARTSLEVSSGVVPTDYSYAAGDIRRYGAVANTDARSAIASALLTGHTVIIPKGSFYVSTFLAISSVCRIEFEPGGSLVAGANNTTFFKTTSFTSGVSIKHASFDGNGHTGVIGFDFTSLSTNAELINPEFYRMDTGIIFRSSCVGVRVDNPTAYRVTNPVVCMTGTNAVTILSPAFDNSIDSGGTGTGRGVYINATSSTASMTKIIGGYIQGFQYGVEDTAFGTSVIGTYFERCSDAAVYLNDCKAPYIADIYHFGFNDTCTIKARNVEGAVIVAPRMVKDTASGGLFDFDATNTTCVATYSTDGFSNTDLGTMTGLAQTNQRTRQTVGPFTQDNVAASQTDVALTGTRWVAPRDGHITGIVVKSTEARTAGTATLTVWKNTGLSGAAGATVGLSAVLNGTNTAKAVTTQVPYTDTFAAGDELFVAVTTDGSWAPTTADVRAYVEVEC